ncbi:dTDP-4-dehydrorhamnose reductase [Sutterella sp.]|uniref:dTDP-4-dehydrorhamnose reductase n=1 Tax=Sutterella sp. TaxID=1981025 RepID=UPI0026DFBBA3|nr:dTDP-4-dehydrorhamnose reductase [Sutterella sp.]MDO5531359.1 dTDP-4-dehydrorhamnose reductase [Sutterella sp.]
MQSSVQTSESRAAPPRVLITGASGLLGRALVAGLRRSGGFEVIPADHRRCDVRDAAGVERLVADAVPDVLVHCAAMTAVDRCETERELAFSVNAAGTENVARACAAHGVRLVFLSTDYVFDGALGRPYTEDDPATGGATVYGQSKFAGERAVRACCPDHVIIRTAWLYGPGGPDFVHTVRRLALAGAGPLAIVNDQRGCPTGTAELCRAIAAVLRRPEIRGTLHVAGEGGTTWFEFAREIIDRLGIEREVLPITTAELGRPAPRPADSRLDCGRLGRLGLPPMLRRQDALEAFLREEWPRGG